MGSELDNIENAPEPRDYTKWLWAGVLVFFGVLALILYLKSGLDPQVSLVRVKHILIQCNAADPADRGQALKRLRDIRERVLQGEDFGKLARDNSNDPGSASKGGDVGYVKKGELAPQIDQYIWSAPIGQLSDIIQTKFGFHIVVVTDRKLSETDALKERQNAQSGGGSPGGAPAPSQR